MRMIKVCLLKKTLSGRYVKLVVQTKHRPMKKSQKHRSNVIAMRVSEGIFIDVLLQIHRRNAMMYAVHSILDLRPKAFNRVGVSIVDNKHTFTMRYSVVFITAIYQIVVNLILIGMDYSCTRYSFLNERQHGLGLRIGYNRSLNSSSTFNRANNRRFARCTTSALAPTRTAYIRF